MQSEKENKQNGCFLYELISLEDLAEKKTKIYSRLLTDVTLAKEMEALSLRHEKRKEKMVQLLCGTNAKKKNGRGRCETNKGEQGQ